MKRLELEQIIEEEVYKYLDEKSVPQPYDRKKRRRMTPAQIKERDRIGKKMKKDPKVVARFRKKYGDDWQDYLWASASSRALGGGFKKKSSSSDSKSSKRPKMTAKKRSTKLTPDQKKNASAMYKQLKRLAKKDGRLDETNLLQYANILEQKFSTLSESHQNFDGPLMTELLHKMVKKLITKKTDTTGESV